jgi:hypothetical protein
VNGSFVRLLKEARGYLGRAEIRSSAELNKKSSWAHLDPDLMLSSSLTVQVRLVPVGLSGIFSYCMHTFLVYLLSVWIRGQD